MSCLLCRQSVTPTLEGLFDTRFGIPARYNVSTCAGCALVQIDPLPGPGELQKLYENYYNFEGGDNPAYQKKRSFFLDSFLYTLWMAMDGDISFHSEKGSGRLLDVGCNEGRGLRFYKRNGFSVEGLETNTVAAEAARRAGYTVYTQDVGELKPAEKFDVVLLSNVLEHFLDPVLKLKQIAALLTPKGQVWISCPNHKSWLRPLFGKYWINWHMPFHISHFDINTLKETLGRAGFTLRVHRTVTPALWATQSLVAALFAKAGKPTTMLRNPVLVAGLMLIFRGVLFPFLWLGNALGRGDCLVVKAEKVTPA